MITLDCKQLGPPTPIMSIGDAESVPNLKNRLVGRSIDLTDSIDDSRTATHYTLQWGTAVGFQDFVRRNSAAVGLMPGHRLGWTDLFERIRAQAQVALVRVYDAACGYGGVMDELFREPVPPYLLYVGADIHGAVGDITLPKNARDDQIFLFRFDISNTLPISEAFDFVICRASIHHTPNPSRTFESLVRVVAPQGRLAISAYAKKGRLRELIDDALRNVVTQLSNEDAMQVARELTVLGKALQEVSEKAKIEQNLEWLGISAGEYGVQELVYDFMLKCWHNAKFGDELSSIVNYDWYHPPFAYRYDRVTLREWFISAGFRVEREMSIKAQHYLEGVRR